VHGGSSALDRKPPVTRQTLRMIGQDFTLDITKPRRELGYAPAATRAEGLASMRSTAISTAPHGADVPQLGKLRRPAA
jgi:nucleoside-diphosphate-sugar epimerase